MRLLLALAAALAAAGCADSPAAPAPDAPAVSARWRVDLRAARRSLLDADAAHADATRRHGHVTGFAAFLADDAVFLPEGTDPLRGRDTIVAWLAASRLAGATATWAPVRADVSADGRHGYTIGHMTRTNADGTTQFREYLSYWTRDAGGAWRVTAHLSAAATGPGAPAPDGFGTPRDNGVAGARPPADPAEALAAALAADRAFAAYSLANGPQAAFEAFAAPNAALVAGAGSDFAYGPAAIGAVFAGYTATIEWGPVLGGAAATGDLAWTVGLADYTIPLPDGRIARAWSKYLTVWQRQPDGAWKYVADGGTPRPRPAS